MTRSGMVEGHLPAWRVLAGWCPSTILRMVPLPFQGRISGSESP